MQTASSTGLSDVSLDSLTLGISAEVFASIWCNDSESLACLCRFSSRSRCGISLIPVTPWHGSGELLAMLTVTLTGLSDGSLASPALGISAEVCANPLCNNSKPLACSCRFSSCSRSGSSLPPVTPWHGSGELLAMQTVSLRKNEILIESDHKI